MAQLNFNATQVEPNTGFKPVPTGDYIAVIEDSEMKPNSAKTGAYLQLKMKIISPEQYAGKIVFDRLNLQNPNQTAVEIAYGTLSAICHATGQMQIQDSQQLHNIPMQLRVIEKPPANGYDASNEVKGYSPAPNGGGQMPPAGQQQPAWQQPQQQPAVQPQQPAQTEAPAQQPAMQQPEQPAGGAAAQEKPPWMQ